MVCWGPDAQAGEYYSYTAAALTKRVKYCDPLRQRQLAVGLLFTGMLDSHTLRELLRFYPLSM